MKETKTILEPLGRLIRHLTRLTGGADDSIPAMTASQRIALFELGTDGPMRLNELARKMGVSAPTASRAVDALDQLGLVSRAPDPADRRAVSLDLSAEGRALFEERARRAMVAFQPAAAALNATERKQLIAMLEKMVSRLDASEPTRGAAPRQD